LKRTWPIQATKTANVVIDSDSLYNIQNLQQVCGVRKEPGTFRLKSSYRQITTVLREAVRETQKQIRAVALNENE
jgi:hypothetical protein